MKTSVHFYHVSLNSYYKRNVSVVVGKSKHTFYIQ
jgi:hypothetical protein